MRAEMPPVFDVVGMFSCGMWRDILGYCPGERKNGWLSRRVAHAIDNVASQRALYGLRRFGGTASTQQGHRFVH